MIDLITTFVGLSSPLHVGGFGFDSLLETHGLFTIGLSLCDKRRAFYFHMLNGLCAYGSCDGCLQVSGLSTLDISCRAFAVIHCAPFTVLTVACQSLGFFLDFNHQSRSPFDVLDTYWCRLQTSDFPSIVRCLSDIDAISFSNLLFLCSVHGLSAMGASDCVRRQFVCHICEGACCGRGLSVVPRGCISVGTQMFSGTCSRYPADFRIALLEHAILELDRKHLFRVLDQYGIRYDPSSTLPSIRCYVQTVLHSMREKNLTNGIREEWPLNLTTANKNELIRSFKIETSSIQLKQVVCACCAEKVFLNQSENVSEKDIDISLFRSVSDTHPMSAPFRDGLLNGLFICRDGVSHLSSTSCTFTLCLSCFSSLRRHRLPSLALANDNYLGDVPCELNDLTFIEELMISLCRAKCSIFQLCESKCNRSRSLNQSAFRGHIIIYPQDPSSTASYLPPTIEEITSLVCVLFIGSTKPSLEWLHKKARPLAVRANKVRAALIWLKQNNTLYRNISLNETVLQSLPSDGVLPFHIEHVPSMASQESLTSTYDNLRESSNVPNESDHISFEKIMIADVEGHVTSSDLRIAALKHVQKKPGGFLTIPHGSQPEVEFGNPTLFPKMYPTLFPYGVGGIEDESTIF